MSELDATDFTFTNSPNLQIFSSSAHNDSQSTINTVHKTNTITPNSARDTTSQDFIVTSLKRENDVLLKKVEYLQKIIKLKDNTIDDLNKKLLSFSSKNHSRNPSNATTNSVASSNNDFVVNLHPSPVKSITEDEIIDPLSSPLLKLEGQSNSNLSSPILDKSPNLKWEIPQRNSNRNSNQRAIPNSNFSYQSSSNPNLNLNITDSFDLSHNSTDTQSNSTSNISRHVINSINSENKEPNLIDDMKEKSLVTKVEEHHDEDEQYDFNGTTQGDDENATATADSHADLTINLQNQSLKENAITESLPSRSVPNHQELLSHNFPIADNNNQFIDNHNNQHDGDNDGKDHDLQFGIPLDVQSEPDSLYSYNSSSIPEPLPLKTPINERFDAFGLTPGTNATEMTTGSEYSMSSNSISGTPINLRSASNNSILNPLTTLQNNIPDNATSIPTTNTQTAPSLPPHPPHPPHHPSPSNTSSIREVTMSPTHQKHVSLASVDDSQKFLLNSLKQCVIRIESLIDPQGLAVPIETITNHVIAKSKRDNYKISFLVYIDEASNGLTPIYRVKRSYVELLIMDKTVRPLVPSLPKLPDFTHVASLNFKYLAHSKKTIQSYINKILSLLKAQNPLNQDNPIWKHFSNYFEFKMDPNNIMDEDPEYSVLNLQEKISYLLYIRKNFTMKTYDFVRLQYSLESDGLIMNFTLSKSQEILPKDEINISFKGQEITIKKKKKFSANKSWSFFAESEYDAHDICSKVNKWINKGNSNHNNDDTQITITTNDDDNSKNSTFTKSNISLESESIRSSVISENALSPAINTPWKLFKKTTKQIPTSPRLSTNNNNLSINDNINSSPSTPSKIGSSASSTPSSNHHFGHSNNSFNDVLNFKAMPYESNKLTVDNTSNNNNSNNINNMMLKSPMRHMNDNKPTEILFQPIDDTPKYFKSTLKHSYELCSKYKLYGHYVPSIVYQCITFLYQQSGEGFEGIFRLNGMMSEVNRIQEIFNNQYDCELSKLTPVPDVHSIATLLKRYLRNLQDRLISNEIASDLCRIINSNENHIKRVNSLDENKNNEIISLVISSNSMLSTQSSQEFKQIFNNRIPQLNRSVLYALFMYLTDVLKMGKHNKMTVSAMSVLMGPNLTQSDGGGQICTVLLENFNQIFV
ncbi:hypothetical protein C6P42_001383 [Pichia californica]|nr:hypothetical protein C6P42_001383 [[Candida] californica]